MDPQQPTQPAASQQPAQPQSAPVPSFMQSYPLPDGSPQPGFQPQPMQNNNLPPMPPAPPAQPPKPIAQTLPVAQAPQKSGGLGCLPALLMGILLLAALVGGIYVGNKILPQYLPSLAIITNPNTQTEQKQTRTAKQIQCTQSYSDTFNLSALNSDFWTTKLTDSVSFDGTQLVLKADPTSGLEVNKGSFKSIDTVSGDFIATLDVKDISVSKKGTGTVELAFGTGKDLGHVHIGLHTDEAGNLTAETNARVGDAWLGTQTVAIVEKLPVTLVVSRKSSTFTTYIKTSTSTIKVGEFPNAFTGDASLEVYSWSLDNAPVVTSKLSGFSFACDSQLPLTSAATACTYAVADDFKNKDILFKKYVTNATADAVSADAGNLKLHVASQGKPVSTNITSKTQIVGDFTILVDVNSVATNNTAKGTAEIGIGNSQSSSHIAFIGTSSAINSMETNANVGSKEYGTKTATLQPNPTKVTLKMVRTGSKLETFYKAAQNTDFQKLGSFDNYSTDPVNFILYSFSLEKFPAVDATFSNLQVNCH